MTVPVLYLLSFLLGSVPFGYLAGMTRGIDIRKVGSGNIGATNTYRALGRTTGIVVFVLDVAKGALPPIIGKVVLAQTHGPSEVVTHSVFLGVAAVLGHSFSPFLGFKGGKGVATGLGAVLGTAPVVGVAGFGTFLVVLAAFRIVSLASIAGCSVVIATLFLTKQPLVVAIVFGLVTLFVILRHKSNMVRLLKGEEPRIGQKREEAKEESGGDP